MIPILVVDVAMPIVVSVVLIAWTQRYMLALRERRIRVDQLSQTG